MKKLFKDWWDEWDAECTYHFARMIIQLILLYIVGCYVLSFIN